MNGASLSRVISSPVMQPIAAPARTPAPMPHSTAQSGVIAIADHSAHGQRGGHARKRQDPANGEIDSAGEDCEALSERERQYARRIEARRFEIRFGVEIVADKGEDEQEQRERSNGPVRDEAGEDVARDQLGAKI